MIVRWQHSFSVVIHHPPNCILGCCSICLMTHIIEVFRGEILLKKTLSNEVKIYVMTKTISIPCREEHKSKISIDSNVSCHSVGRGHTQPWCSTKGLPLFWLIIFLQECGHWAPPAQLPSPATVRLIKSGGELCEPLPARRIKSI